MFSCNAKAGGLPYRKPMFRSEADGIAIPHWLLAIVAELRLCLELLTPNYRNDVHYYLALTNFVKAVTRRLN